MERGASQSKGSATRLLQCPRRVCWNSFSATLRLTEENINVKVTDPTSEGDVTGFKKILDDKPKFGYVVDHPDGLLIPTERRDWALTFYSGKLPDATLTQAATFNFKCENAYFIDLALSRRLYTFRDYFNIEIEGPISKHFGDQDQWEFNGVAYFRWLPFPWDAYLDTSFAAGAGLSYATSVPKIEAKNHDETARLLGALMFEFAFSFPRVPQWSLITRLHHRSGAGGVFNGVRGASNAWAGGIRYSF